jgi:uncharacterized iron-regulated membrane protein
MGDRGSNIVELVASWTIVMILTGLYLWWPRQAKVLGGVAYPRLRKGRRVFWRDLHAVTGVWISSLALCLLLTGLPWAKFWGNYFRAVRHVTGTAGARQDWTISGEETSGGQRGEMDAHGGHGGHGEGWTRRRGGPLSLAIDRTAFDRIVATVRPLELVPPVVIAPPAHGASEWTAKSLTPNRPKRVNLALDAMTGTILSREDFRDRPFIDRMVGIGIAAHEGQLFGWANQLLGLLTALGLILLCISAVIIWWRRRELGVLGAGTWLTERLILRRFRRVSQWLGLDPPVIEAHQPLARSSLVD